MYVHCLYISGLKLFKEQEGLVEPLLENAFDFFQSKNLSSPFFLC